MTKVSDKNGLLRHPAIRPKGSDTGSLERKIVILKAYEEAVGPLNSIEELHGTLLAEIGKVVVALPVGLSDALSANLDRRIAILRTDIPGKEYLLRAIPEEKPGNGIT